MEVLKPMARHSIFAARFFAAAPITAKRVRVSMVAISALAEGYDPYAIIDASGTWNKLVQEVTIHRLAQAGVKVSTWASALAELMNDWRSEKAYPLANVLGEHTSYGLVYESYLATQKQEV